MPSSYTSPSCRRKLPVEKPIGQAGCVRVPISPLSPFWPVRPGHSDTGVDSSCHGERLIDGQMSFRLFAKPLPASGWLTLSPTSLKSPAPGGHPKGRAICHRSPSTHGLDPMPVERTGRALAARGRHSLYEHMFWYKPESVKPLWHGSRHSLGNRCLPYESWIGELDRWRCGATLSLTHSTALTAGTDSRPEGTRLGGEARGGKSLIRARRQAAGTGGRGVASSKAPC